MKISEKINLDYEGLKKYGPVNIVALGDSVTHGSFGPQEIDYEYAYWNQLKKKINEKRNYVPINVINAGIGGTTAKESVERMESQVLCHNPDLIIICFGLNDVNGSLEDYLNPLEIIFEKSLKSGAEVIFLTPNMLNTYLAEDTEEIYKEYAVITAEMQNSGKMDLYINSAVELAKKMNVTVCDCYKEWKKLSETTDTTMLLANRINHPTREMHGLFADRLYNEIFKEDIEVETLETISTMYESI